MKHEDWRGIPLGVSRADKAWAVVSSLLIVAGCVVAAWLAGM
jgi:hypothetical protein